MDLFRNMPSLLLQRARLSRGPFKGTFPIRAMTSSTGDKGGSNEKGAYGGGALKYGLIIGLGASAFALNKYKEDLPVARCNPVQDHHRTEEGDLLNAYWVEPEAVIDEPDFDPELYHYVEFEAKGLIEEIQEDLSPQDTSCRCQETDEKPCGELPGPPSCQESCIHRLDCVEECIANANSRLENVLKTIKSQAQEKTEETLKLLCEAKAHSKEFLDKGYEAIEVGSAAAFCEVYEIAQLRCEKMRGALEASDCAWELLCRLRDNLDAGKCCEYTHCNPLLLTTESFANTCERELVNARMGLDCVRSNHSTSCTYCSVISGFKAKLQAEVPSDCQNDCQSLVRAAYKKLIKAQQEMALLIIFKEYGYDCSSSSSCSSSGKKEGHGQCSCKGRKPRFVPSIPICRPHKHH